MPAEGQRTRIAVLIDADNASPRHAEAIFVEIAKLGEAIVRRVYGDFASAGLKGWNDKLARHALVPVQTVAYTKGKNASDIAMVIDAMDLSHTGLYDAFCLVSSDSDFTRLAQRLRESGAEIYGLGERKTPESFRQSCRRFFFVENLARDQAAVGEEPELELPQETVRKPVDALPTINRAYERHVGDHADGWVPIRELHRTIANFEADFDPRSYGETRLGDLAGRTGAFEVKHLADRKWCIKAKSAKAEGRPRRDADDMDPAGGLHRTIAKAGTLKPVVRKTTQKTGPRTTGKPAAKDATRTTRTPVRRTGHGKPRTNGDPA